MAELPKPDPGPGRVVVRIRACGVAHRDLIERQGHPRLRTPIVLGHEFAGDIVDVGPGVTAWQVGDRVVSLYRASCGRCGVCQTEDDRLCPAPSEVYGMTTNGGYAEFVSVAERGLERLAEGISWERAALVMGTVGVGYNNVVNNARVLAGEHVLVTGASGGVGLAAVQTARWLGARVWAVTSQESKRAELARLGAEHVLADAEGRFHEQVRARRPEGVDAVIDCVGAPTLRASLRSLRRFGRVVAIGTVGTPRFDLSLGYLVVNSIKLLGSENVSRVALREAMRLVADGSLQVQVDRTLPLSGAAEAHRLLEQRAVVGRIVLVPEHD